MACSGIIFPHFFLVDKAAYEFAETETMLQKAEEEQRKMLAEANGIISGTSSGSANEVEEYSVADLDKIHQLLTARGMAVPKEALIEILGTPQGKELLMQMKQLQQAVQGIPQ